MSYKSKSSMFHEYPDVMEVKDVMKALKIGRHAVYGLIESDLLRSFKIGKAYKITKGSLIKYIETMGCKSNYYSYNYV